MAMRLQTAKKKNRQFIFLFVLFKNIGERSERGARERKIKNVCRHLWGKRGVFSPSPTSTPHHYHLGVRSTNEIEPMKLEV